MSFTGNHRIQDPRVFRVISFVSLGLVFAVIIIGAFLSARGQGLSCSDWPLCPTGFSLSPEGEYFIEYVHRIVAVITAVFVYVTACYAIKRVARARRGCYRYRRGSFVSNCNWHASCIFRTTTNNSRYSYGSGCHLFSIGFTDVYLILPSLHRSSSLK